MNSLDLDVIERIKWDIVAGVILHPLLQLHLVCLLDVTELLHEIRIGSLRRELRLKCLHLRDPLIDSTNSVTD